MEKHLVLTGWGYPEYLAAAAALYGRFCETSDVDVRCVSKAALSSVLGDAGARYARIDVLGVGLDANPEKLAESLKALSGRGVRTFWWSRIRMPDETRRALRRAGASFGTVVCAEEKTLLDVLVKNGECAALPEADLARLQKVSQAAELELRRFTDLSKLRARDIWLGLFLAAGFAHRDHHDDDSCGRVVKALWDDEPVKPGLNHGFKMLLDDYRAGHLSEIVGRSEATTKLRQQIGLAARYDLANVLILGETGTGKQVVAEQIHFKSSRREGRFIHHNCAYAGNDDMLMDRLFGHEKGAFTGAAERRPGLFDDADGGTLFLDEIGEAKADVQAMLLTVLETGSFLRVGGSEDNRVKVNVRLICATNRNLQKMVLAGTFRLDLYERLCDFPIRLAPLRERRDDIADLVRHFWPQMTGQKPRAEQIKALEAYDYPGNARELVSLLKRAWALCPVDIDDPSRKLPGDVDFSEILATHKAFNATLLSGLEDRRRDGSAAKPGPHVADDWPERVDDLLHVHAVRLYEKYGREIGAACKAADVSRNTFKKYLARG